MGKFVKLGKFASFFRDSAYDISVAPNEVVELNVKQLNSAKVKKALNGGHLVFTDDPKVEPEKEISTDELTESFIEMVNSGEDPAKVLKTFTLKDLKTIAETMDIEVEATDTKKSIFEALVEEVNNNKSE